MRLSQAQYEAILKRQGQSPSVVPVPPEAPPSSATNLVLRPTTDEAKLNKLEKAWLAHLRLTHPSGDIFIQAITFKLGADCRYTPDFTVIDGNGRLVAYECKGFMRDDALVKLKVAARSFRWVDFVLVRRVKGRWELTNVKP